MTEERLAELMVKAADGVASPEDREELMAWVVDRPDLQRELEEHQALRAVTDGWMSRLEADLMEDRKRTGTGHRLLQGMGVAAVFAGLVLLTLYGPFEAVLDPEAPTALRLGFGLTFGGAIALLVYLGVHRISNLKNDPYNKVIR